jgi:hypothetical protein
MKFPKIIATVFLSCIGLAVALPAQAVLAIDSATWDGRKLVVEGTDGRGGVVEVFYTDYETDGTPILGDPLGSASVKGSGRWKLQVSSNRKNPLNPVPCAVSATLAGDPPIENFPVAGAPADCAPQPPVQQVCNIAVTPTTLAFGNVTVGTTATLTTTVSNSGAAACDVTLTQPANTDFAAAPPLTFTVAPASSQVVSVNYTPSAEGPDTGTLAVGSNDPDTPNVDVALSGTGIPVQVNECDITVSPASLAFGQVNINSTSAPQIVTVSNNGTADCTGVTVALSSAEFSAVPTNIGTLAPANTTSVSVTYTPANLGVDNETLTVSSNEDADATVALTGVGVDQQVQCVPADLGISINSTSQDGCPDGTVPQQPIVNNAISTHSVLAINDLGMHCGDLDTRISSILPPFQVLLAQVIEKGGSPSLNPVGVDVFYSAASNPNDPILGLNVFEGMKANGDTFKTNFWDFPLPAGSYDAFYPAFNPFDPTQTLTPLAGPPFNVSAGVGLPVPNVEDLYIGLDGLVNSGDEELTAVLHAMPGIAGPYTANDPQLAQEHYVDKPFFVNFPFGYVAAEVNWYEGAGIPFAAFDDNGRENAYPLVRVEARDLNGTVATVDTVLPISGEASCTNCHAEATDYESVEGIPPRTQDPITALGDLPVATTLDDPDGDLPPRVSLEYATDINVLRLHDLKHGARYVNTACDNNPAGENCLADPDIADPCTISAADPNGSASCLTNKALVQNQPVVCQVCHYTPALDLAQLGPLAGPPGTIANGRNQVAHESNSRVLHNFHGQFADLFTPIPAPAQNPDGSISNQGARLAALEDNCYQCHPGTNVKCLRGAMFDGGMLCSDCHGGMNEVGNDFSAGVSPETPGAFVLGGDFYNPNDPQPRVPWANEPGCGSCHTGDANDNLAGSGNVRVNLADNLGNDDGIRLRQAFRNGDGKATPIVPTNKRFAEPAVPASFNGFDNPGAGNPQLYRVSTGHGGVMCEGCHGATHAEFDIDGPGTNDDVASVQLQGHAGTIVECEVCHGNAMNTEITLDGPHGMHPVGDQTDFADGGHSDLAQGDNCTVCHGPGGRGSNVGTVLSVAKARRDFTGLENGGVVEAGEVIGCTTCHN